MKNKTKNILKEEFLEVYDSHAEAVYRHCYWRVFNKHKAEDFMHEAFMRTWEYLEKGNDIKNIKAFVYRVATNLIIDDSRKKKEEKLDALLSAGWQPEGDGAEMLENKADVSMLMEAMYKLSDSDRDILIARFLEDLQPAEIADFLNISPNATSVRVNRAVGRLKKIIKKSEK